MMNFTICVGTPFFFQKKKKKCAKKKCAKKMHTFEKQRVKI